MLALEVAAMDSDEDDAGLLNFVGGARAEVISVADGVECIGAEANERAGSAAADAAASE